MYDFAKKLIFISANILFVCFSAFSNTVIHTEDENEICLSRQNLLSISQFSGQELVLAGSFFEDDFQNLTKEKFPNLIALSVKHVNQPSFFKENVRQSFLSSLCNLPLLERLSLENQNFYDAHLKQLPRTLKLLDIKSTSIYKLDPFYSEVQMRMTIISD